MAPSLVQAGSGFAAATGDGTVSVTGTTAGNAIVLQIFYKGTTRDYGIDTFANVEDLAGTDATMSSSAILAPVGSGPSGGHDTWEGRSLGGDVSVHLTVGASGEDLYARLYEWDDVVTIGAAIFEAGGEIGDTGTTVSDISVTTLGTYRVAYQYIALSSNQSIPEFSGETGGDWVEPVAEFTSAVGTGAALGLQVASMPLAETINGGTLTVTSTDWGIIAGAYTSWPITAWITA